MELELPADPDGFVRRECPRCRRGFKTRPGVFDAGAIQSVLLEALPHANAEELTAPVPVTRCPYCGHAAGISAFLWSAHRRALEEVGVALGQHVRYQQLVHVWQALAARPAPTFVPVAPPGLEPVWPEDDGGFEPLHFPCCEEMAKVLAGECERHFCPACGAESHPRLPALGEGGLDAVRVARGEGPP